MPTYEYRCPQGHDFEKFYRSIGAAPRIVACPTCGKTAERQLSAGAGLVFKGSGFYITDYGKDGKKAENAAAADAKKPSDSTGSEAAPKESAASKTEPASASKSETSGDPKSQTPPKPPAKPAPPKPKSSE